MKFNYQDHYLKSGIYKITNTKYDPPRFYIGQTGRFAKRWADYKRDLPKGIGHNKFLCNDYSKCLLEVGNDDFLTFEVLEVMENSSKEQRETRETEILDPLYDDQKSCYNFKKNTKSKERSCHSHTPEETFKLLSIASKRRWKNPDYRAKNPGGTTEEKSVRSKLMWETRREELTLKMKLRVIPEEIKQKLVERSQKTYNGFISPEGVVYSPVTNLRKFARDHNLSLSRIDCMVRGKQNFHKGWRSVDNPNPQRKKFTLSEEHKKKIGLSKLGNKNNVGRVWTEEQRKQMSEKKKVVNAAKRNSLHKQNSKE